MSRGVQPKKVDPLIRGARYSFLIAGWFYGASKKAVFTKIEATERVKREAVMREEHKMKLQKTKNKTIGELQRAFKDMGYEPEPNWEEQI